MAATTFTSGMKQDAEERNRLAFPRGYEPDEDDIRKAAHKHDQHDDDEIGSGEICEAGE